MARTKQTARKLPSPPTGGKRPAVGKNANPNNYAAKAARKTAPASGGVKVV